MEKANKILAVDDNIKNLAIFEELLEDRFNLMTACSGEQALQIAEEFKPDLVLLKDNMPGIDGYQICRRIREIPSLKFTRIIMVSANTLATERIKGRQAGADDYIIKPFDSEELIVKIQPYLYLKSIEQMEQNLTDAFNNKLKTPMTTGKNVTSNEQSKIFSKTTPQLNRRFDTAIKNIDRISRIIRDAFDITRIDTGNMELYKSEFSINDLITETAGNLKNKAAQKQITISSDMPEYDIMVYADRRKIQQVIWHLIDNAVQFNHEGGNVCVELNNYNEIFQIKVEDDGPGINIRKTDDIFSKFVPKTKKAGPGKYGTGLGLPLAKGVVELHGGNIRAENKCRGGAVFTFEIPKKMTCELNSKTDTKMMTI